MDLFDLFSFIEFGLLGIKYWRATVCVLGGLVLGALYYSGISPPILRGVAAASIPIASTILGWYWERKYRGQNLTQIPSQRMHRVFLVPHDFRWADEFARESSAVAGALGGLLAALHHIGSTAIPGIRAKPIIDMLAVVTDLSLLDGSGPRLESLGYESMGEFGIPGRRYFRKNDHEGNRSQQIHAFRIGSPQIERHLAFRDFLRAHPDLATQYDALKSRLAELYPSDIVRYSEGKDEFIHEMDEQAAAWRAARRHR